MMSLRRQATIGVAVSTVSTVVLFGALILWIVEDSLSNETSTSVLVDADTVVSAIEGDAHDRERSALLLAGVPMVRELVQEPQGRLDLSPEELGPLGEVDVGAVVPRDDRPATLTGPLDLGRIPDAMLTSDVPASAVIAHDGLASVVSTSPLVAGDRVIASVLLGRTIDGDYLQDLSTRLGLDIDLDVVEDGIVTVPMDAATSVVDAGGSGAVAALSLVDPEGRTVLGLAVRHDSAADGTRGVLLLLAATLGAAGLFGGTLTLRWLDRRVLQRVHRLAELVERGPHADRPPVELEGGDELAALAQDVETAFRQLGDTRDELESTTRELEEAIEARARTLSALSHDLRAPLTVIQGWAETLELQAANQTPDQHVAVGRSIHHSARRLDGMLHDLLTLGQAQSAGLRAVPDAVPLAPLVARLVVDLDVEDRCDVAVGDVDVWADPSHLERALQNLLTNARKYGAPPYAVRATTTAGNCRIEVHDHGAGVPEAFRDTMFDAFTQASPERHSRSGSGLGLAIVRELAAANGGSTGHERVGDTTVVWLTLPTAPS